MKIFLTALVFLLTLAGCHAAPDDTRKIDQAALIGHYVGVLPCADCQGRQTRLELQFGEVYQLQETYLGRSTLEFHDHGSWSFDAAHKTIVLRSTRRTYLRHFRAVTPDELQALNPEGGEIAGVHANAALRRER